MTLHVAVEFEGDRRPARGRALVDAARAAGADWVVLRVGADLGGLRPTAQAAAEAGLGVMVRVADPRVYIDLPKALDVLGALSVPALRDRLLVVASSERAGRRLRTDCRWAPSAADLGAVGWPIGLFRRIAPNFVRASCATDDLLVPAGLFSEARIDRLAAQLRLRGARLWIDAVPQDGVAALRGGPAHGVVVPIVAK